jgi:antitoxin ParD1/3/4
MPGLTITLSGKIQSYIEKRLATGRYRSAADYIEALVSEDRKQHARADLTGKFLEGFNTSAAHQLTESDWKGIRDEVRKRLERRPPDKPRQARP